MQPTQKFLWYYWLGQVLGRDVPLNASGQGIWCRVQVLVVDGDLNKNKFLIFNNFNKPPSRR